MTRRELRSLRLFIVILSKPAKADQSKEAQVVQQRSQSPQSHGYPRLYKSPQRRPLSPSIISAARVTHSPTSARRISPQQLAEIGKLSKSIGKSSGSQ